MFDIVVTLVTGFLAIICWLLMLASFFMGHYVVGVCMAVPTLTISSFVLWFNGYYFKKSKK